MRTIILTIVVFFSTGILAQLTLSKSLNTPRAGDRIVKQQVEYKDPGRAGANVVWDFGQLETIKDRYTVYYIEPRMRRDSVFVLLNDTFPANMGNSLLLCREHFTTYCYQSTDSTLILFGYENKNDRMKHYGGLPVSLFPMTYNDSIDKLQQSEDLYSGQIPINTHGIYSLKADAYGVMVIPSGDTVRQVLRTHSVHHIVKDSIQSMDSIHVNSTIENYKWYARGYRYPMFETVRAVHRQDSIEDVFETAFFYPPPQESGNDPDVENMIELERMQAEEDSLAAITTNPWVGMYYNISPNPAYNHLVFELYLPRPVYTLRVQIRNQMGQVYIDEQKGTYPEGISSFTFNISMLSVGNYILDFWLDGYLVHGSVVMKR